MITFTDFFVTVGFAAGLISFELSRHHLWELADENAAGSGVLAQAYMKLRLEAREVVKPLAEKTGHFFQYCLPEILGTCLAQYASGLCNVILAYERYVLITLPTERDILLSPPRRKKIYAAVTLIISVTLFSDAAYKAITKEESCHNVGAGWQLIIKSESVAVYVANTLSQLLFSGVPFGYCLSRYIFIIKALLTRKKKIGRNIHLVLAFGCTCAVWFLCFTIKQVWILYSLILEVAVPFSELYKFPLATNLIANRVFYNFNCVPSFFSPFVLVVLLKNYRKPFKKTLRRITCRNKQNQQELNEI